MIFCICCGIIPISLKKVNILPCSSKCGFYNPTHYIREFGSDLGLQTSCHADEGSERTSGEYPPAESAGFMCRTTARRFIFFQVNSKKCIVIFMMIHFFFCHEPLICSCIFNFVIELLLNLNYLNVIIKKEAFKAERKINLRVCGDIGEHNDEISDFISSQISNR